MSNNFTKSYLIKALLIGFILTQGSNCAKYHITDKKDKKGPETFDDGKKFKEDDGIAFTITVEPRTVEVGGDVRFSGTCGPDNQGTISWNFGDGAFETGADLIHRYSKAGVYTAEAVCTVPSFDALKEAVTITVTSPCDENPSQNPNQNPGGCDCDC